MSQSLPTGGTQRNPLAKLFQNERAYPYLLIVPSLLLIALLMFVPLFSVFKLSLENFYFTGPFR